MENTFTKRVYSFSLLVTDTLYLIRNFARFNSGLRNRQIGKPFMEKIMLVVTAINGCRYCAWFHAKQAASSGISDSEIKNMLDLQFGTDASEHEMPALLYAQHYTETNRHPDKEMVDNLFSFYGEKTAKHVQVFIRMIYSANLAGNTFDAFLSRLKGEKAEDSNALFEFVFFVINIPFLLPLLPYVKKYLTPVST